MSKFLEIINGQQKKYFININHIIALEKYDDNNSTLYVSIIAINKETKRISISDTYENIKQLIENNS